MRYIQKVIATGISLAMATTMCVAVPATGAIAAETDTTDTTVTEGETSELTDINEAIKSSFTVSDQFLMDGPVTPLGSIKKSYTTTGDKLTAGKDYNVVYENNDKLGTATATLTGIESAGFTGTKTITFQIVNFYINVTYKSATGKTKDLGTLSWSKIQDMMQSSTDNDKDLYYQYNTSVSYVPAKQYLTFESIMNGVGVTGWKTVVASGTDGFAAPAVTAEMNDNGKFYPAQTTTGYATEGAVNVPAILALSSASAEIETTAAASQKVAKESTVTLSPTLRVGALEADYTAGEIGGNRFVNGICNFVIDDYTPLKANPITVSASKKTVKNNKKQKIQITTKKAQGTVTYAVKSAASKKAITVSKKGVVTIAKGAKTGKYVISVTAAGNKNYKAKTKTVTIKVTK